MYNQKRLPRSGYHHLETTLMKIIGITVYYYGVVVENKIVAATPLANAPPPVVILTDIRSHCSTLKSPTANAQQFGLAAELGPVIVAVIPVATGGSNPQSELTNISADATTPVPKALSRILKTKPVMVASCGTTNVFRIKLAEEVPKPRKSRFPID